MTTRLVSYVKENKTIRSNNHVYMMTFKCNSINYADNPRSNYAITWLLFVLEHYMKL